MNHKSFLAAPYFLLCTLFTSVNSYGTEQDVKQTLKDKLQLLKTFQADFSQTVVDLENTVLQQADGKIMLQQPNRLYWELLAPNDNILIADGNTLWNIDPFMEQVVAYNQASQVENNPLILLTDPNSDRWQDFVVSLQGNEYIIAPVAQNSTTIEKLGLVFDSKGTLKSLQTTDSQQQVSTLLFSNINQNKELPVVKFTFSLPNGYELDDQRAL